MQVSLLGGIIIKCIITGCIKKSLDGPPQFWNCFIGAESSAFCPTLVAVQEDGVRGGDGLDELDVELLEQDLLLRVNPDSMPIGLPSLFTFKTTVKPPVRI